MFHNLSWLIQIKIMYLIACINVNVDLNFQSISITFTELWNSKNTLMFYIVFWYKERPSSFLANWVIQLIITLVFLKFSISEVIWLKYFMFILSLNTFILNLFKEFNHFTLFKITCFYKHEFSLYNTFTCKEPKLCGWS